ncbi:MAG TPA: PspC domain-containing protein [Candidatus Alistipes avicola]|uniref:PspC domain-containing protein n=1 Tax=Candidatus Alistipes avicola TaxID=2838432 RepID=A0A9D2IBH6_9BACT|nr:PspC domain-containing protein [uncultured Alistipes sp.]HJA98414.1 PspC domain-containing protein [Candidatus Alistipes avicola]
MSEQRSDRRLTRSADNVVIAGVCAGVADYFGLKTGGVRLVTLLLILFGGLSIWVYIILWIVVPRGNRRLSGEK